MRCECGGDLQATKLASYDFTAIAGLPSELRNVRGLRCPACGATVLEGRLINTALNILTCKLVRQPARLTQDHARFVRRWLGLSQQALADKMGIDRVTVARWESSGEISLQNDLVLRGMALANFVQRGRRVDPAALVDAMSSVHRTVAPAAPAPLVVGRYRNRPEAVATTG
jgi:DNA-binding XRE family transcriptional regulator